MFHYVDNNGAWLGSFSEAVNTAGYNEVPSAPSDGKDIWNGSAFVTSADRVWEAVKTKRTETMAGGISYGGNVFQSRDVDALNVTHALVSAAALTWPINVDLMDNTRTTVSQADAQAICDLMLKLKYLTNENAQTLRAQIYAAADPATVDIAAGWPTVPYTGA